MIAVETDDCSGFSANTRPQNLIVKGLEVGEKEKLLWYRDQYITKLKEVLDIYIRRKDNNLNSLIVNICEYYFDIIVDINTSVGVEYFLKKRIRLLDVPLLPQNYTKEVIPCPLTLIQKENNLAREVGCEIPSIAFTKDHQSVLETIGNKYPEIIQEDMEMFVNFMIDLKEQTSEELYGLPEKYARALKDMRILYPVLIHSNQEVVKFVCESLNQHEGVYFKVLDKVENLNYASVSTGKIYHKDGDYLSPSDFKKLN